MNRRRWVMVAAALVVAAPGAESQAPQNPVPLPPVPEDPECYYYGRCPAAWWAEEVAVLGANALLGALSAGIWQELRGGSFQDGFARGALGGAVGYAGKRIVAYHFPGAGLVGREVAAVGHSIIRNAAEGRGTFSRVALPLLFFPARVQLGDWGRDARVRVDALSLWYFAYGLIEPKLELDWGRSLSWGAAVFATDSLDFVTAGRVVPASATIGTIFINRRLYAASAIESIAAHERVHVAQADVISLAWGDALDDWLEARVPGLGWISRYVAANTLTAALLLPHTWLQSDLDHWHLPWELEAMALAGSVR